MFLKIKTTMEVYEDEFNLEPIVTEVVEETVSPKETWDVVSKLGVHHERLRVVWDALRNLF